MENMNTIYLRRSQKVVLESSNGKLSTVQLASLLQNVEALGYTFSKKLIECVSTLTMPRLEEFYLSLITDLKKMTGANRRFEPMYPNFPAQVMDSSDAELYLNAIMHYMGDVIGSRIMPKYEKDERLPLMDYTKLKVIDLGTEDDFVSLGRKLIGAKTSISETDKIDVEWFLKTYKSSLSRVLPKEIPHKENLTFVASKVYAITNNASELTKYFKSATDVLRFAVGMSGGDVSLADKTRFRNFKNAERRMLVLLLEGVGSYENITEDILRHEGKWIRLGEKIHPGSYKTKAPNVFKAFHTLRNKNSRKLFKTFNSKVETALLTANDDVAVKLLVSRPGDMARRLDHLLRMSNKPAHIVVEFGNVIDKVSTPVLLQVSAHFNARHNGNPIRTIFPKGNVANVMALETEIPEVDYDVCMSVVNLCKTALLRRFAELEEMGKVYVDPKLKGYIVPFSQRSASKSLRTLVRGSRVPMADGGTVRFFLWWKDMDHSRVDIDLSSVLYDADWNYKEHISYTNLRSGMYNAAHSGDITSAPNGACEFIDLDIDSVVKHGGRYVIMNVLSYTGQPFTDMPECFAGWMMRQAPNSGEVFDARAVEDKVDLTADTKICIPVILDLVEREVIWTDVALKSRPNFCVNVESNKKGIALTGQALTTMSKFNLYDLFNLHATARATEIVNSVDEADTVFTVEGAVGMGVTPFDIEDIMSEYL